MFRSAESLMEEIMAQSAVPSSTAFRHSFGDSKVSTSHRGVFLLQQLQQALRLFRHGNPLMGGQVERLVPFAPPG